MARRSRVIRWLSVILPLLALLLLSTLFLAGKRPDATPVLPYVTEAPEDAARGAGIAGADMATTMRDGSRLRVTAGHAIPQNGTVSATDLRVEVTDRAGKTSVVTAPKGQSQGASVELLDGVTMTTSDGWTVTAPDAAADGKAAASDATDPPALVTLSGGVQADAPFGTLNADRATLRPSQGGGHVLDLTGRVRLIYRP